MIFVGERKVRPRLDFLPRISKLTRILTIQFDVCDFVAFIS